ncbi:Flp pilus assembly protein CpaB [Neobacillus sp. PS2-9]|uniref:Flp pilus assembly protein CpaB n=1 Tax=Neobacillus sp. PS2-9 TaxID=3070676 RepID=UPI0027E19FD7|nr:Flp pilus assembly protein CpaB [Neobacillus sp. PS2-9]WML57195.1 Flp pilus assembly protein CpaB [Neobacillus sp. PS2-9]
MKSKMVLLLSLVMGMITTFLFFQYTKQMNTQKVSTVVMTDVVVAKEKIDKNEKIAADKLEVVQKPAKDVLPQTIKSVSEAEGKLAIAMIEKGEPILSHRLGSEKEEGVYVSRKVMEGYRAVTVGVNINQSVSNLIEPEDEVDVVFTKVVKDATNQPIPQSVILLEKARVLAVGRKMQTPEQTKEPYTEYSSVTLELKPEDALKLVNASEEGKIHFILNKRPLMDEGTNTKANQ